jgi:hypothetical protein
LNTNEDNTNVGTKGKEMVVNFAGMEREDIAQLAEYYGVPDMPITDFISVDALRSYLEQYRRNDDSSEFFIVRNVSRVSADEVLDNPEMEGLRFDYFDEFSAIVVRGNESQPHEEMHGSFENLLHDKVRDNGISDSEFRTTRSAKVYLGPSYYLPDSSRKSHLQDRDKPNVVIEAGFLQSLESPRAKARDYITGQIVRRRTEPDAEGLADILPENQLAAYSVDFLNTRIREKVENMDNHQFETGVNLVFIISHNDDYTVFILEAWARSFVDSDNCLRVGAVQIERRSGGQFAVGILPFGQARDLTVTPAADWVTDDDGPVPELLVPLVFLISRNPAGRERDVTLTSADFQ